MDAGGINAAGIATTVWSNATRSLVTLGVVSAELISVANSSLAASASLDLRPGAGKLRDISVGLNGSAAGNMQLGTWDGAVFRVWLNIAAGAANGTGRICGNATVGPRLLNGDASNAGNYMYGGIDWA